MHSGNARTLWQAALGELQLELMPSAYQTYLKDTVGLSDEGGRLVVGTRTALGAEWLDQRLRGVVCKTLRGISHRSYDVEFRVHQPQAVEMPSPWPQDDAEPAVSAAETAVSLADGSLPLNLRYKFEGFVPGNANYLAHAAALGIAEGSPDVYNPLFLYGGSGLGKSHLLHAIGHRVLARGSQVLYVTGEHFMNDFIQSLRDKRTAEFRQRYRSPQVLLVDDIHILAGKEQTQEEFFHTFDELHTDNRQVVLTSDRPPGMLPGVEERLRSRFEWGLIADIQPPDMELRLAILHTKAANYAAPVPDDVLQLIARRYPTNVRALEGALNRVVAFSLLTRTPITTELATQAMADLSPQSTPGPRLRSPEVLDAVAQHYSLAPDDLRGARRTRQIALARHVAMYLLREYGKRPLSEIGRDLGGRDHSTVLHGCGRVTTQLASDTQLRSDIAAIQGHLARSAA